MLEHLHHLAEFLGAFVALIAATFPWTYRWVRNIDLIASFVRHAHDVEFPHIHNHLEKISPKVGFRYSRPLQKIDLNGK